MKLFIFLSFLFIISIFTSCNYEKKLHDSLYFNDMVDSSHRVIMSYDATIKVGDRLSIQVSALSPESALPYNMISPGAGAGATSSTSSAGYLVENDGSILFPQLGRQSVVGKTLIEVRNELLQALTKYLTDPTVTVQFANAKVLVMGEVGHPLVLPIPDGKLTILEAITLAGDVPNTGRKDNILVIREENGQRTFARVNLQSHNIYKSPYYFLRQNDLVYVEANKQKIKQQSDQNLIRNISLVTSVFSILTTALVLNSYFRK